MTFLADWQVIWTTETLHNKLLTVKAGFTLEIWVTMTKMNISSSWTNSRIWSSSEEIRSVFLIHVSQGISSNMCNVGNCGRDLPKCTRNALKNTWYSRKHCIWNVADKNLVIGERARMDSASACLAFMCVTRGGTWAVLNLVEIPLRLLFVFDLP